MSDGLTNEEVEAMKNATFFGVATFYSVAGDP